jgi:hypothetical protein
MTQLSNKKSDEGIMKSTSLRRLELYVGQTRIRN